MAKANEVAKGGGVGGERSPGKGRGAGPTTGVLTLYTACCVQVRARLPAACGAGG